MQYALDSPDILWRIQFDFRNPTYLRIFYNYQLSLITTEMPS